MSKVAPDGDDSDSSISDHESEGESGAEDDAPKPKYKDFDKAKGYEDLDFEKEADIKPPKGKELEGERPEIVFNDISQIKEDECRDALIQFVSENCCYGSSPAKEMTFKNLTEMTALHPCQRCGADGMIMCMRCRGRRRVRCGACNGRGRRRVHTKNDVRRRRCISCLGTGKRTCPRCGGNGQITCPRCDGCCNLKLFIELTVRFKNHKSNYIWETSELPDHLIKKVRGDIVLKQELDLVWPLVTHPIAEINNHSQSLIKKHANDYSQERILQQRQILKAVPVTEVEARYDDSNKTFWVYGKEKKVYFPDYPQKCCWGCQIL